MKKIKLWIKYRYLIFKIRAKANSKVLKSLKEMHKNKSTKLPIELLFDASAGTTWYYQYTDRKFIDSVLMEKDGYRNTILRFLYCTYLPDREQATINRQQYFNEHGIWPEEMVGVNQLIENYQNRAIDNGENQYIFEQFFDHHLSFTRENLIYHLQYGLLVPLNDAPTAYVELQKYVI